MTMFFKNPEIQKHIWLDFSPIRIISMPVIFGLIFYAYQASNRYSLFFGIYFLCTTIWANMRASKSFPEETGQKTWDFIRMSSIPSWSLTLGKLIGSILFPWYFGIVALALAVFGDNPFGDVNKPLTFICLILAPLVGNAATQLISILSISDKSHLEKNKDKNFIAFLFGIGVSFLAFCLVLPVIMATQTDHIIANVFKHGLGKSEANIFGQWYGLAIPPVVNSLMALTFMTFWIIAANYRAIQKELLYKLSPSAWTLFIATHFLYMLGYTLQSSDSMLLLMGIFYFHLIALIYVTLIMDASNMQLYKRFALALQKKDKKVVLENTPKWLITMLALGVVAVIYGVTVWQFGQTSANDKIDASTAMLATKSPAADDSKLNHATFMLLPMASFLLFTIRDGIVFHYFGLVKRGQHAIFNILFYYLLAYYLLPMAHEWMVGKDIWAFHKSLYNPFPDKNATAVSLLLLPALEVLAFASVLIVSLKRQRLFATDKGASA